MAFRTVSFYTYRKHHKLWFNIKIRPLLDSFRSYESIACHIPHYLYFNGDFIKRNEKLQIVDDMKVFDGFISSEEEKSLFEEVEPQLKRMRYESGHWDNAIAGYRETEKLTWNSTNAKIIERVKSLAFNSESVPLKHVHVLDLDKKGVIMPHVDSIKFCGTTIAGISLLSDSVMRLIHNSEKEKVVDVLLKRCSLYIMTGIARYDYTHEILSNEMSKFGDKFVEKNRRISVICRNEPATA